MSDEFDITLDKTKSNSKIERRRPGRSRYSNPHLVALLRQAPADAADTCAVVGNQAPAATVDESDTGSKDDLAPARGVALGALIGAAIWSGIILLLVLLVHIAPLRP